MVNVPGRPEYNPSYNLGSIEHEFALEQSALDQSALAREGPGRFAEPRINPPVEDITQRNDNVLPIATDEDGHIVADAIIQAAQDTVAGGWQPTQWDRSILQLPEQQEEVPTLGGRVQQPHGRYPGETQNPVPGITVDNSGRQYSTQNVPPPNTLEALGSAAVLNVPLAATGFALGSYDAVATKFPELVDMLASGKYRTDDPEIVSRAVDIAGIVTSGSFAARVTQDAMRARSRTRGDAHADGEPFTAPRDLTLDVTDAGQGRFNVRAQVGDEQAVDAFVRNFRTSADDPGVLQFGRINIEEPWQRQGIATAIQNHLEATTGRPFIPDGFLTEEAYKRWLKIDPDAVKGHVRMADGDNVVYQRSMMADIEDQMRTGRPYTETARMAEVRRAHAAGELQSPLGPQGEFTLRGQPMPQPEGLRGGFILSTGGAGGDTPRVNFEIRKSAKITGGQTFDRYRVEMTADGESIGWAYIHPLPEANAFKFSSVAVNEEWQRRGINTALQQTLEARLGLPMMPDNLLTREAYGRWLKLDREAVHGKYDPPGTPGNDEGYWTRTAPYEETARSRQVREDLAAGRLREPRIRREDYSLGMGGARDRDIPPWRREELENQRVQSTREMSGFDDLPPAIRAAVREYPTAASIRDIQYLLSKDTPEAEIIKGITEAGERHAARGRGAPTLGMGAARDPDATPTPRQLDPAGYYSHAHDVTQRLQPRGTPEQMWRGIERGGVREVEVRQLGLDELLLGKPIAEARRLVVDHTAELGRMRQEAKDLGTREGQDRYIARRFGPIDNLPSEELNRYYGQARQRQAQLNDRIPESERRLHAAQQNYDHQYTNRPQRAVSREDIARHIEENRPNIARETYSPPRMLNAQEIEKAATALEADGGSAFSRALINSTSGRMIPEAAVRGLINELKEHQGTMLGAVAHGIEQHYRLPQGSIGQAIKEVTGRPIADFSFPARPTDNVFIYGHVTLDPKNPSLTGTTLRVDTPTSAVVERLWSSIPPKDAAILRAAWRTSDEVLAADPSTLSVIALRKQHRPLIDRISKEIGRDHFVDPHYADLNIFGHYMSSVQRLTPGGDVTFVPHQVQSGWGAEIASTSGRGATRGHPIVTNLQSWLDPTLRDIVRNAVDSGANSISLPSAETVFRYNPPGESSAGLRRLYNESVPRRFQAIMRELDPKYSSRGDRTNTLHTYEGDPNVTYRGQGLQSGTIKRVNGTVEDARNGFNGVWTTYPITPAIRRNFEQGRGMRLFSGGVPVAGEQDGQTVQP